jgi:hypothetical protein
MSILPEYCNIVLTVALILRIIFFWKLTFSSCLNSVYCCSFMMYVICFRTFKGMAACFDNS